MPSLPHSPRQRSLRQLARALLALLPVVLVMTPIALRAGELPASNGKTAREYHTSSKKSGHKPTRKSGQKATRKRKNHRRYAPAPLSVGARMGLRNTPDELALKSSAALVVDQDTGTTLTAKNADAVLPVASLTKLMTALVVVDSGLPMDELLEIGREDVDTHKRTHSRLKVGTRLTRDELLLLALMSSENRAAMALSRHYPGGREAFLARMNLTAQALGMASTRFADAAGLSQASVSTARDLHRLMTAAYAHPLIRDYSTQRQGVVRVSGRRLTFSNSNRLLRKPGGDWNIELQKTGFTNEAGRCLVMQVNVMNRRLAMIFLDSSGTMTRYADAARVRRRLEREARTHPAPATPTVAATAAS